MDEQEEESKNESNQEETPKQKNYTMEMAMSAIKEVDEEYSR